MGEEIIDFILFLAGAALLFGFGASANRCSQRTQNNSESGCYSGDSVEEETIDDIDLHREMLNDIHQRMYIEYENNKSKQI